MAARRPARCGGHRLIRRPPHPVRPPWSRTGRRQLGGVAITAGTIASSVAGTIASSVALIGFGLDSVIEVSSAAAVAWQFAGPDPEHRERVVLRVVAGSFFALAAYVALEAARTLVGGHEPERSVVGIALVALSVVVMPFLSLAAVAVREGRAALRGDTCCAAGTP